MTFARRLSVPRFVRKIARLRVAAVLVAIFALQGWPGSPRPLAATSGGTAAGEIFGPRHYVRTTGAPITERTTFTVSTPGDFTLRIDNGGDAGQFTRATSAVLILNGVQIVGPNEFSPEVAIIEKTVTLLASNVLDVELRGAPGSGITVSIAGEGGGGDNHAPVADAGPDQNVPLGSVVTLDGTGSHDADGDALTYHWTLTSRPSGSAAALSNPNTIHPTFTADVAGTYGATLVVNDGTIDSAPDAVSITTANTRPVADAGPDQSTHVGRRVTLDGSASRDADGDALTYHWMLTTLPPGSLATLSDPSAVRPTFDVDEPGTYVARLIVNDGTIDSAPDTVAITTENTAPVANAGPDQSAPVGTLVTLDGSASNDADGDALTYHWTLSSRPAGSAATLSDPAAIKPTFTIDVAGAYVATLIVNDGAVNSAPDTVSITTANSRPVANAGPDQSTRVGQRVTLDGSASSDVDGDALTYHWSLIARPAGSLAALSDPAAVHPTFDVDAPGTYVAQLIVNDGLVDSVPDTVTITTENSAPVANAGPDQTAAVGAHVTLDGGASHDVDGDTLTFHWTLTSRPAGSAATLSDPAASTTSFDIDRPGTYVAQLIVNDGTVDSAPDVVVIDTVNSAPVANAGADQSVRVGDLVTLDGSGSTDLDGDLLTFRWTLLSRPAGSTAALSDPNAVSPTFTVDRPGTYVAQLIVNDGHVDSAPDSVSITTLNSPPVANAGADQSARVGDTVVLDGSASHDVDGDPLTYRWALISLPAGSTATLSDPNAVNPSFHIDMPGTYVAQLIVNDGTVDSAPDAVSISTVNSKPTANAGADQTVTRGATVTLDGSASSDPDGDPLTYAWSITARPAGSVAALSNPTVAMPTITPDVAGTYVFQLIVSDTQPLASDPDTVTVTVRAIVPNVVGMQQAAASAAIVAADLVVGTITSSYSNVIPAGEVISQSPVGGTVAAAGSAVDLEVSAGPQPVEVPNVVGMLRADAEAAIVAANLTVGSVTFEEHPTVPAGHVIRQSPDAGTMVAPQSAVDIVVSLGPGAPRLQSIAVTAASASLAAGNSQQYTAIGTWTDGHTENITATATWSSTNQPVATVNAAGVGQALEAGNAIIQATKDGVTGGAALTVTGAVLESIVVTPDSAILLVGQPQTFTAQGVLTDGTGTTLAGVVWSSNDPARLQINAATGAATAVAAGPAIVSATVGSVVGTAQVTVQPVAAGDVTNPTAAITTPADNATITDNINIVGTATDANFSQYILDYATLGSTNFTEFTVGTTAVNNGVLGQFDPTLLINDIYTVRLRVFDRAGRITTTSRTYSVTRDVKVGAFSLTFQDLIVPAGNLPIVINRVYDTRDKSVGDFGFGSRLDIQTMRLRATPTILGASWQQTRTGVIIPQYCLAPVGDHKVTITLPNNKVEVFDMVSNPQCQNVAPIDFGSVNFVPRAGSGTTGTLVALDGLSFFWNGGAPGPGEMLDDSTLDILNPQRFRYTTADGYVYTISRTAGVESIRDPNNNTITIGPGGIIHSGGKSVTFTRDASNRITQINAPGGEVHRYAYTANGDLTQYTDAAAAITRYFYNLSHGLIEIRDPRGMRPVRNEYDDDGRLVATIDAQGNRIEYAHDLAANRETITDRLGRVQLLEYDATGNVTRQTHPDGTTTQRTFDARGNALTETNELGGVTTKTFNALDQVLTRRDELNNLVESYTYDARGNILTFTDGRGNVTTSTYDAGSNVLTTRDGEGFLTQFTYDGNGKLLTTTDPRGAVTTNVYDAASNLIRTTDPAGVSNYTYDAAGRRLTETRVRTIPGGTETLETRFAYDAAGRLIETTHPDGTTSRNEYDLAGNLTATIDQLGRRTTYTYDASNRKIRTTFPDATFESSQYDAEGQRVAGVDRAGRTTTFTFDSRGRVKREIAPDGTFTERQYNAAGRLSGVLDENGHGFTQTFDAAGRVLTTVDATGRTTTNTYDIVGNRISSTDSGGQTTTYEFDRRNLLTRTNFPGGTNERYVYNQAAQLTSTFDADNAETRLMLDLAGRVTQVTNPLNQSWSFTYDEIGNRVSQTDPLGRITRFEYDRLRRETRRTLPLGASQQRQYDAAGNLIQRVDYGGAPTTYTYDSNDRLLRRTHPDASFVTFSYNATGERLTATDARGTTTYSYDVRDRLTQVTQPDGTSLQYAYDPASNLSSRTANVGAASLTQAFGYDFANRLLTVTDSQARAYTYSYNPAGKVASLAQPNGVATAYSYGAVNRLTGLITSRGGTTLQSFAYTLSPVGRRTRIDEVGGVARQYTYDGAGRLTSETVTGPGGPLYADTFVYNAVGNRTSRGHSVAGGAVATTLYTYDDRDRILLEGGVSNTWDANGRLTSKSDGTSNVWDSEGRLLLTAAAGGGSVTNEYDADGNRVKTTNFPSGGAVEVTNFLVDARQGLSHVVVEYAPGNIVTSEYVRGGDQLLAVVRPGGTRFYHADGLGSIRALSDASGAVTDTYEYDAFGNLTAHVGSDPNPYLFTGEPLSPISNLYHLRARWMDPATGRFLSIDPKDGIIEQTRTLHRYLYAGSDPVNHVDPSGEFDVSIAGLSISINIQGNLRATSGIQGRAVLQTVQRAVARLGMRVKDLRKLRQVGEETHHLIEKRLWELNPKLQTIWRHVDDMPGWNLLKSDHQAITNAWRAAFPYSNQAGYIANPSIQQIMAAAENIYAAHPEILKQIYLYLLL